MEENNTFNPVIKKILTVLAVLAVIGMGVSAYLTYMHYKPEASEICTISERFNCDVVNKSMWSYIDLGFTEMPVAIGGFFTYLVIFFGVFGTLKNWKFKRIHKWLRPGVVVRICGLITYLGFLFSLYLTYVEAFKLKTFCLFCVAHQIDIFIMAILFAVVCYLRNKAKKEDIVCEFC